MFIEPGTKIISGVKSPHDCVEKKYKYVKIRGTLVKPSGDKVEYNMLQCNKCGAIVMRGDKVKEIEHVYKNYEFIHVPKKKPNSTPTKRQIKNSQYLVECAIADAQGKPRPKGKCRKMKPCMETPDYVFKGEAPKYMQYNAFHPFRGGGVSPR